MLLDWNYNISWGNYKIYDYQDDAPAVEEKQNRSTQRMTYFHVPYVKEILVLSMLNLQNIAL